MSTTKKSKYLTDPTAIREWLAKYCIITGRITIAADGAVSVDGDVQLCNYQTVGSSGKEIFSEAYLPLKFDKIQGRFNCSYLQLVTLEGCPNEVEREFHCTGCPITTLAGGPSVCWTYIAQDCHHLTSLRGAPAQLKHLLFSSRSLTTLADGPVTCDKYSCYGCRITDLSTLNTKVNSLSLQNISMQTLEYLPERTIPASINISNCDELREVVLNVNREVIIEGAPKLEKFYCTGGPLLDVRIRRSGLRECYVEQAFAVKLQSICGRFHIHGEMSQLSLSHTYQMASTAGLIVGTVALDECGISQWELLSGANVLCPENGTRLPKPSVATARKLIENKTLIQTKQETKWLDIISAARHPDADWLAIAAAFKKQFKEDLVVTSTAPVDEAFSDLSL